MTTTAPRRTSRAAAMSVLIAASFLDLMDTTVVNVALPSIQEHLHTSAAALEWVVGGYTLAFALVLVTGGRLGDSLGRQRVFVIGVAGFTLASLAAALATDADVLVVARLVQGVFAGLMVPQVLASVQALFAPGERAPLLGIIGAATGLAAVAGPVVGGALVSADILGSQWRSIFLVNVPLGVALVVAALIWVPDTRSEHPPTLDVPGVALLTAGLGLVVYPLVEGGQEGWPAWIWAMMAASPVVLAVFVVHQHRRTRTSRSALLPMTVFRSRGFAAGVVAQFSFTAAMSGFFLVLTLYLQLGLHFAAIGAGLVLLPFSIGAFAGSGLGVPLAGRLGKPMVFAGAAFQVGGLVWVRHVVAAHGDALSGWDLLWPLAVVGFGLGVFVIPLVDLALADVDTRDAGAASGAFSTFQQIGAALGVAVVGVVFYHRLGGGFSSEALRTAFLAASWVAVAGYALAALASLLLPPSRHGAEHAAAESGTVERRPADSTVR